jgi:hypothetical protein
VEGKAARLVSWSLVDGGLGLFYVRSEEMWQAGVLEFSYSNGPKLTACEMRIAVV